MKYRAIGDTDLKVSEIGFGAWGIGGDTRGSISYGATDDKSSIESLKKSLESGINFYDTSDLYGFGHSEELIGNAFEGNRDKVVIATKAGWGNKDRGKDFSASFIEQSIFSSLKRLKTDYIDLFQLHNPSPEEVLNSKDLLKTLEELKKKGIVREIGISARTPEDSLEFIRDFPFKSVALNFNMMDIRPIEMGIFEQAKIKGIGIIARTPLCFGFLSGKISRNTEFSPSDHRSKWDREQINSWIEGNEFLRSIIKEETPDQTDAQVALRFCLSFPEISTTIPGMLFPKEVEENARASEFGVIRSDLLERLLKEASGRDFFLAKKHWVNK